MKYAVFLAFYFISISASALPNDDSLSRKLNYEYRRQISKTQIGEETYKQVDSLRKGKTPKILLRYFKDKGFAYYALGEDIIYLNTRYIAVFFDIKGYKESRIIKTLNSDLKLIRELAAYSDGVYFHELIHSLQDSKYGKSRYMKKDGLFLEFEYEAYFLTDMYFHEKMRLNPKLFRDILSFRYWDIYTGSDMAGYLAVSASVEKYKESIRKRYENEMSGYVNLSKTLIKRKSALDESKVLDLAGSGNFEFEKKDFEDLLRHRQEYIKFLSDFYLEKWPKFSYEALSFIIENSTAAGNYPMAMESAYRAFLNVNSYETDELKKTAVQGKAALVFLEAASYIRDKKSSMTDEELFFLFYWLDKYCLAKKSDFPEDLNGLRLKIYSKYIKQLLKRIPEERDADLAEYYKDAASFTIDVLSENGFDKKDFKMPAD